MAFLCSFRVEALRLPVGRWRLHAYAIHEPLLAQDGLSVYRGISGEQSLQCLVRGGWLEFQDRHIAGMAQVEEHFAAHLVLIDEALRLGTVAGDGFVWSPVLYLSETDRCPFFC